MPNAREAEAAQDYLEEHLGTIDKKSFYCAPYYNEDAVRDETLLAIIRSKKPHYIGRGDVMCAT